MSEENQIQEQEEENQENDENPSQEDESQKEEKELSESSFDDLSDEDILAMSEEDALKSIQSQSPESDEKESEQEDESDTDEEKEDTSDDNTEEEKEKENKLPEQEPFEEDQQKKVSSEQKQKSSDEIKSKLTASQIEEAIKYYETLTTPFKADGRDFSVKSPEDAKRLIQQGVNYSKRMQELKPQRQLYRTLQDHNMNDLNKINHIIDIMKGDKKAISQLLQEKNINPEDLDPEENNGYKPSNYGGSQKDNDFRDALDEVIAIPEGKALVNEIYQNWDQQSKVTLSENPVILGNLLELKRAGIYDQILSELDYQKSIGYLQHVPFLQAFDQVGQAMRDQGVFNKKDNTVNQDQNNDKPGPLKSVNNPSERKPVDTGIRKEKVQRKEISPQLSSNRGKPLGQSENKVNWDQMSDEEFSKAAPPV